MNDTFQLTTELVNADIPALNAIVGKALSRAAKGFTKAVEAEDYYQDKKRDILRTAREQGLDLTRRSAKQSAEDLTNAISGRVSLGPTEARDAIVWRLVWFDSDDLIHGTSAVGVDSRKVDSPRKLSDHRARSTEVSPRRNESIPPITAEAVVDALRHGDFDSRELQNIRQAVQKQLGGKEARQIIVLPDDSAAAVEVLSHSGLSRETVYSIRTWTSARLPQSDLEQAKMEEELQTMRQRVFADAEPSIPGFRQYLKTLAKYAAEDWTAESRVDAAVTANYWKRHLRVEFTFDGELCTLKPKDRGRAGFQLRKRGIKQETIYTGHDFPALGVKKQQH